MHAITPVATNQDANPGDRFDEVELWEGLNDSNRGQIAFWAKRGGVEYVVKADLTPVLWIDFTPVSSPDHTRTTQNLKLLDDVGIKEKWTGGFINAANELNVPNPQALIPLITARVQKFFDDAQVPVRVLWQSSQRPAYQLKTQTEDWTAIPDTPVRKMSNVAPSRRFKWVRPFDRL